MKRGLVASVFALLVLVGCTTGESGIVVREMPFAVGRTTFRETVAAWGNPDSIKGDVAVWRVTTSNGGQVRVGYMMVGVTASSQRRATREYRLSFDKRGVLKSLQACDSVPDGADWSVLPW